MKLRIFAATALAWLACAFTALGANISGFDPAFGAPGDMVNIYGGGFDQGVVTVRFNGVVSTYAGATTASQIIAQVPTGATSGPISVQIGTSTPVYSSGDFTVIGSGPYISGFSPVTGSGGTTVLIEGAHFETVTNAYFDGKKGNNLNVGYNTIQVDAPAGVTSGKITVRSPLGSSTSAANFYVPPAVTSFSPSQGRSGTNVLIKGVNFLGTLAVTFGGTNAEFTVLSNSAIRAIVPPLARSGAIRVYAPADSFPTSTNFVVLPTIYGFSPGFGSPGSSVLITGANFTNLTAGATTVRFNNVQATISDLRFDRVTAVVPASATTGPISIKTSEGGYTNSTPFYVTATITSFTPTNSPPGSLVKITGTNFTAASAVSFGGIPAASFTVSNNTTIGATVPIGVLTGPISVTTPAGTVSSAARFYGAPQIYSFSPTRGLPGTNVLITGVNFLDAKAVRFNGLDASWFAATNNSFIYAKVPVGAQAGLISVVAPAGTNFSAAPFNLDYVDLGLSIVSAPIVFFVGSNSVLVFAVTNNGPAEATNARLTNTIPYGTFVVSATSTQGTLTTNTGSIVAQFGTLPAGALALVTEELRFSTSGSISIAAGATGGLWETTPTNNSVVLNAFVHLPAVLSLEKLTNQARLTWPLSLSNFVLQHKFNMAPANQWINNPSPRLTTSTENLVIDTNVTATQKFYRLRGP